MPTTPRAAGTTRPGRTYRAAYHAFPSGTRTVIDDLLSKERDRAAFTRLLEERAVHDGEIRGILDRMKSFVRDNLDNVEGIDNGDGVICGETLAALWEDNTPDWESESGYLVVDLYDVFRDHRGAKLRAEVVRLEAEHSILVDRIAEITAPMAVAKLNDKLTDLENRISSLRAELEPLSERWDEITATLRHLRTKIAEAESALLVGSNRLRAQALRACIRRIDCRYERGEPGSRSRTDGPHGPSLLRSRLCRKSVPRKLLGSDRVVC